MGSIKGGAPYLAYMITYLMHFVNSDFHCRILRRLKMDRKEGDMTEPHTDSSLFTIHKFETEA